MTTIAPPLRTSVPRPTTAPRVRTGRRGAALLAGVVALTGPAYLTLIGTPDESGVIAGATALSAAAMLSLVVAWTIWRLAHTYAPVGGVIAAGTLAAAATTQLYASLTLLWNGTAALPTFFEGYALVLALTGVHLAFLALLVHLLDGPAVVLVGVILAAAAVLAAVFPPGWHPQTSDALIAVTVGQALTAGWMLWGTRR